MNWLPFSVTQDQATPTPGVIGIFFKEFALLNCLLDFYHVQVIGQSLPLDVDGKLVPSLADPSLNFANIRVQDYRPKNCLVVDKCLVPGTL
jgi:hypothetical protein